MTSLVEAIDRLIEANVALRKRRSLAKLERTLAAAMGKAFRAEERAFLRRFAKLKPLFTEAVRDDDWGLLWNEATGETTKLYQAPLELATETALQAGMDAAVLDLGPDLGIKMSFDLKHPDAVEYIKEHGTDRIKRIRQTTREGLRSILAQAADEGWSYEKTADAIHKKYKHMSVERGRNIAIFELGDGYEHGNMLVGKSLQAAGLEMQKSWGTSQDDLVRPAHSANEREGWIPLDDAFSSGHDRPPTDPRCRCFVKQRRKPDDE